MTLWGTRSWWLFPILMPITMLVALFIMLLGMREFFGRHDGWRGGRSRSEGDETLAILRRRFASGEITEEEFEEKRKVLQRS